MFSHNTLVRKYYFAYLCHTMPYKYGVQCFTQIGDKRCAYWMKLQLELQKTCDYLLNNIKYSKLMKKILYGLLTLITLTASTCSKDDDDPTVEKPQASSNIIGGHEYVEIGGVKWATMNVGATTVAGSPSTCYGDYYAWGETEPRYVNISIDGVNDVSITSWKGARENNGYSSFNWPTYIDKTLDAAHDVATKVWGNKWHMPSESEFKQLVFACNKYGSGLYPDPVALNTSNPKGGIYWLSSSQTYLKEYTGIAGTLYVDAQDTSRRLFFPAAGHIYSKEYQGGGTNGDYWTSDLWNYNNWKEDKYAMRLRFDAENEIAGNKERYYGCTVRPVAN